MGALGNGAYGGGRGGPTPCNIGAKPGGGSGGGGGGPRIEASGTAALEMVSGAFTVVFTPCTVRTMSTATHLSEPLVFASSETMR